MFFVLLLMQAIDSALCYDIELEGAVHFGKDLIRRISNDIVIRDANSIKHNSPVQLMAAEPIQRSNMKEADEIEVTSAAPMIEVPTADQHLQMDIEPTEDPSNYKIHEQNVKFRFDIIHQLSESGTLRLKMLAYFMKKHLNVKKDIRLVVYNATNDYLSEVNDYYVYISPKPVTSEIDKEFIVLDMVETTNKILLHQSKKLLDAVIGIKKPADQHRDLTVYLEKIKSTVIAEKQEQLQYVCKTFKICRTYPGYCDHIADMLSELLQLTDKSFQDITKALNETITIKRDFFKTILRENVYNKLSKKLNDSMNNVNIMREVFSLVRAVITRRHKVFNSDSMMINIKTKAVRLLLDLIDKAFDVNDNNVSSIDIENTISSYKQWALGERTDVDMITKKFIYNAIEILNFYWGTDAKEEAKVLTDVIFTGGTQNVGVYDYLFTKGSMLIRDIF